jgi:hypothetical protein
MNRRSFLKLFGGLLSFGLIPSTLIEAKPTPGRLDPNGPDNVKFDTLNEFNWQTEYGVVSIRSHSYRQAQRELNLRASKILDIVAKKA